MTKKYYLDISKAIRELEILSKKIVTTQFVGQYRSVFKGTGYEFADYRQYIEGEDASNIDWKASARTNKLLVKEFVEERSLNVYFLVDISNSMLFGSTDKLKSHYAIELTALLSYSALKANDRFGLTLFNDKTVKTVSMKAGQVQFFVISRLLSDYANYGGNYDLDNALKYLINHVPKHSVVFVISDFIGTSENWKGSLRLAAKKFDLMGIMIRDPRDEKLPENYQVVLQDPFSKNKLVVDSNAIGEEYSMYAKQQREKVENSFLDNGAEFLYLTTDKSYLLPLIMFFERRKRKWK